MVTQSTNARQYQLRVRFGTSVRETIDLGRYGGGEGYYAEEAWLWATIKLVAETKEKEARGKAKETSAHDRLREKVLADIEVWLTGIGATQMVIQRTVNRLRRHNVEHECWTPFRSMFKGKAAHKEDVGNV